MWNERDIWLRHHERMAQLRHEAYVAQLRRRRCDPHTHTSIMEQNLLADSRRARGGFVLLAVVALLLPLVGCASMSPPLTTDNPQAPASTGALVHPLTVHVGDWWEYEVVSANHFQVLPDVPVEQGDRIRFAMVGSGTVTKMGLDMTTSVTYTVPLCDVSVNGERVGERVGETGTIAFTAVYPTDDRFWEDYQAVEESWNDVTAAQEIPYHGEIRSEPETVLVEFGYTAATVVPVQGTEGVVDVPIERGVTSMTVDRDTGIVLEQQRDASGRQASYHLVLMNSSNALSDR